MSCIVSDHIQTCNGSKQRLTNKQTMAEESTTRKITLREFKPESYKVWAMSTKATLSYNKLFDIVDGTLTDPTPRDDSGAILRPIPGALKHQVEKWKNDHERARDAIIRCLPDTELLKLGDVQDDVTATSNTSAPPTILRTSKWTRKPQSTTTSTSLSSLFMTSTTTNRQTQRTWKNRW